MGLLGRLWDSRPVSPLDLFVGGPSTAAKEGGKDLLTAIGLGTAKFVGGPTVGLLSALGAPVSPPDYGAFDRGAAQVWDNRAAGVPSWTPQDVQQAFRDITPPAVVDVAGKTVLVVAAIAGAIVLAK